MIFLEFPNEIVNRGIAPSNLCSANAPLYLDGKCGVSYRIVLMADQIYELQGNKKVYFKNRYKNFTDIDYISDEEKIILVLRAVPMDPKS